MSSSSTAYHKQGNGIIAKNVRKNEDVHHQYYIII